MVDSQHDKRYVGRAEALMRYIEERAKVLMLDTRLAIEEWEMAVDYAIRQHNHMPALSHKRTIKSRGAALGDSMPRGAEQRGSGAPEIARERGGARPQSVPFTTTTPASSSCTCQVLRPQLPGHLSSARRVWSHAHQRSSASSSPTTK